MKIRRICRVSIASTCIDTPASFSPAANMRASTASAVSASPRPTASVRSKIFASRVWATIASTSASPTGASPACISAWSSAPSNSLRPVPTLATSAAAASREILRPCACASPITKPTASSSRL
ncbi:hypothetical protein OV079_17355 [Nannocystis pusilla]|uniref:Uncharacterized protein n=1 Tax=Nannocystis pusilla TaxID=889268 RepID=A0A9X3EP74_9BACT|nr:hypothetical protein [Nannocystis pusilla]MCY1007291.1 hypothetical protein [Nannocystis pusilla]